MHICKAFWVRGLLSFIFSRKACGHGFPFSGLRGVGVDPYWPRAAQTGCPADRPKNLLKICIFACFRCSITDWAGVVAWSALGGLLGASWCILGLSWSHLGGILGQHTGLLEHILGVKGLSGSWTLRFYYQLLRSYSHVEVSLSVSILL